MSSITTANRILMTSILSLAPAASSSAIGGARGQFRQIAAGMGGAASVASVPVEVASAPVDAEGIPVDLNQIKREMSAYNSLKANGVQAEAVSHSNLSQLIPMKDKQEMKDMLNAFNTARAGK
ncbi:hypothetical protein T484DRAFT_1965576 [Baffinella frigidus]|nr:hypothetical protein T484DRAFT_1965576 [Cryptophyta sp. CCMP2293]